MVVTIRGSDFKNGVTRLNYFVLRKADAITTVNQTWAEDIRKLIGTKVFYTPDGVEISEELIDPRKKFGISSDKIIVLYVGALRFIKGADLLAKIADLTMKMNSSVQFLIVGPGDPKKFGLDGQPNVICTGSLAHREVLAIFPQCDLFVFPTRHEGRGIVFLEAMASGLPCVTTALSVITEILTEETGIVVQVEDVKTFAEKICALSSDPMKRKIMGEKAKHRIKELSLDWNTSAANYLWIFQKLTLRA